MLQVLRRCKRVFTSCNESHVISEACRQQNLIEFSIRRTIKISAFCHGIMSLTLSRETLLHFFRVSLIFVGYFMTFSVCRQNSIERQYNSWTEIYLEGSCCVLIEVLSLHLTWGPEETDGAGTKNFYPAYIGSPCPWAPAWGGGGGVCGGQILHQ
jgi:hypothetical protein